MVHGLGEHWVPPALLGATTWLASIATGDKTVAWVGLGISAGWLTLGFLKHRLAVKQWRERRK